MFCEKITDDSNFVSYCLLMLHPSRAVILCREKILKPKQSKLTISVRSKMVVSKPSHGIIRGSMHTNLKIYMQVVRWNNNNWNDRRSRRVFLCFYSAIFQLTSAKFQTFAYNSRTVGSSNMKFWQQFEINELYVCTKFRGNRSRDFGFTTRKPPRKFGVKSGLSQKRLK